jgi:hypothetical protein
MKNTEFGPTLCWDDNSEFNIPHSAFISGGGSSVGRASAFQAECREFESRPPLSFFVGTLQRQVVTKYFAVVAQG